MTALKRISAPESSTKLDDGPTPILKPAAPSRYDHFARPDFWFCYRHLPPEIQELADKNFALLRETGITPRCD
jgi:hypothetical protein